MAASAVTWSFVRTCMVSVDCRYVWERGLLHTQPSHPRTVHLTRTKARINSPIVHRAWAPVTTGCMLSSVWHVHRCCTIVRIRSCNWLVMMMVMVMMIAAAVKRRAARHAACVNCRHYYHPGCVASERKYRLGTGCLMCLVVATARATGRWTVTRLSAGTRWFWLSGIQ